MVCVRVCDICFGGFLTRASNMVQKSPVGSVGLCKLCATVCADINVYNVCIITFALFDW